MKNIFLLLIFAIGTPTLAQGTISVKKINLEGKWKIDSTQDCHSYWTDSFPCFEKSKQTNFYTIEFLKNGTYISCAPALCDTGTYIIQNDSLLLKSNYKEHSEFFDRNYFIEKISPTEFIYVVDSGTEGGPIKIREFCIRIE